MLLIVFVAEALVMFIFALFLPQPIDAGANALLDSTLLTLFTAPILWWVIIGPLRRLAIAERARAASIVKAAADGIVTTNDRDIIESFNVAAEQIFGYSADEVIGRKFDLLLSFSESDRRNSALISEIIDHSQNADSDGSELRPHHNRCIYCLLNKSFTSDFYQTTVTTVLISSPTPKKRPWSKLVARL